MSAAFLPSVCHRKKTGNGSSTRRGGIGEVCKGFAYVPQAAVSLASETLRIPRVVQIIGPLLSASKTKSPLARALMFWRREGDSNPR